MDVTPEQILSLEYGNIYDSIIYTSDWTEKGFELRPFHIEKREWQEPISFSIEQKRFMNEMNPQEVYMPFTKIADGKLYIIYPEENGSVLKIMDLESRQEYFTGLIKPKRMKQWMKIFKLHLMNYSFSNKWIVFQ